MSKEVSHEWNVDWPDYIEKSFVAFIRPGESRIGTLLRIVTGRRRLEDLSDSDCTEALGFAEETCRLKRREITAEIVKKHCDDREIRDRAEDRLCNVIFNLIFRCESLNDRVTELEAAMKEENRIA